MAQPSTYTSHTIFVSFTSGVERFCKALWTFILIYKIYNVAQIPVGRGFFPGFSTRGQVLSRSLERNVPGTMALEM